MSSRTYLLACLMLLVPALLGRCNRSTPREPEGVQSAVVETDRNEKGQQCHEAKDCPEPGPCEVVSCADGRCQTSDAPERQVCALSDAQYQAQIVRYRNDTRRQGVCYQRRCLPRVQCAEECGERLALSTVSRLEPELERCRQLGTDQERSDCSRGLSAEGSQLQIQTSRHMAECMERCGYARLVPIE